MAARCGATRAALTRTKAAATRTSGLTCTWSTPRYVTWRAATRRGAATASRPLTPSRMVSSPCGLFRYVLKREGRRGGGGVVHSENCRYCIKTMYTESHCRVVLGHIPVHTQEERRTHPDILCVLWGCGVPTKHITFRECCNNGIF